MGQEAMSGSVAQNLVSNPTVSNEDSSEKGPDSRAGAEQVQDELETLCYARK